MIGRNNPFNIRNNRRNKWKGQIGSRKGFCEFSQLRYGIRVVLFLLMVSYRKQGINTIRGIIERFAPSVENDTYEYISNVCQWTNFGSNEPLVSLSQYCTVLSAMSRQEGNYLSYDVIYFYADFFCISPISMK